MVADERTGRAKRVREPAGAPGRPDDGGQYQPVDFECDHAPHGEP
jgi:hypothetical protein